MDHLTPEQRHYNMSQIHGKDTKPEILVRKYLFSMGPMNQISAIRPRQMIMNREWSKTVSTE